MSIKNQEAIINLLTEENARLKTEIEALKNLLRKPIEEIQKKYEKIRLRQSDTPIIFDHGGGCGSNGYGGCGGGGGCGR